jgi:hypothetical protein
MKLYVLVRKDLSKSQQAVQSGHAVAEWLLREPSPQWGNGTLVYLGVKNERDLHKWMYKLEKKGKSFTKFVEPDIGDQVTAIASLSDGEEFKSLDLLRL